MVEPYFVRREKIDQTRHQVMGQERTTLRLFREVCGDRPVSEYRRSDLTSFLGTLRRLPNTYGRSPKDRTRTVAEMIAEAESRNTPRLEEFADVYGGDLQCDAGTWFLNILETEANEAAAMTGRSLKTRNATRTLPLHPEVIRLGFVQYAREGAASGRPIVPRPPATREGWSARRTLYAQLHLLPSTGQGVSARRWDALVPPYRHHALD
ncbi:site-specific integrase [Neoroseomonas lacus]|uniref:Uncharacterized protein n=1 Tax=Neoroseomonas lacus TaxID=287609 RepID=A0A917L5T8_9PROT|nr:hypothetical protein [Neoroseomonas lacus]GGJ43885.1 hypothetical protein GCM10011320_59270 [Neoroseomonas lacus]